MSDIVIDSAIRTWVVVPIVVISFLFGLARHYLSALTRSVKSTELVAVSES